MEKTKKITIQDVARFANVSAGTIDRVIHNRGRVSLEKKKKVEEAIRKLNFNPNILARTLALGNRFNICVLIPAPETSGHYWSIPPEGIDQAIAMYTDYGFSVKYYLYNLFSETTFVNQTEEIFNSEPDGVVLAPLFLRESTIFVRKLREKGIPYIFIDADIPGQESLSYIGPDVKRSGYIAGKLLNSVIKKDGDLLVVNMVKGFRNASALRRMETGFKKYFNDNRPYDNIKIHTLTINSTHKQIVHKELAGFYGEHSNIKGVFVTNSKAFLVSGYHLANKMDIRLAGFDLVEENIIHLKNGGIDYIISQSPIQQGARAIQSLFEFFIIKNIPPATQYVPLDIIIRENLDFYLKFYQKSKVLQNNKFKSASEDSPVITDKRL